MPSKNTKFEQNKLYLIGFRNKTDNFGNFIYKGKLMRGKHFALVLPYSKRDNSFLIIPTTSAKLKHFDDKGRLLLKDSVYDPKTKSIFLIDKLEISDMPKETHFLSKRNGRLISHEIIVDDSVLDQVAKKVENKLDKTMSKNAVKDIEKQKLLKANMKLEKENKLLKEQLKRLKASHKKLERNVSKLAKMTPGIQR